MNFLFFNAANTPLFSRDDAESVEHTHEEMSLNALFPYDPGKVIERGMRIGYTDSLGVFQVFEIRKPKTYEPDHYQEITAEHIVISELTDEFFAATEWTNITAQAALTALLTGTLWSVGTVTASGTSSANIGNGNVWQDIRSIETNWNVTITPRLTVSSSGITGRYLDIAPAGGTWRGLRLSLEKNLDDAAVTWDDSNVKTALYGFGKSVDVQGQTEPQPLTFADAVWTATADHPAKPSGQTYLEDPAATAAYGRNGRPRFGFYQNADIDNADLLLEKTWETLKTCNFPDVSIDGTVHDLHRLGYTDVPLRLHDLALTEIRQTGVTLQKEIIRYTEDLLNPLNSRVTIGTYIPNIIYINRETSQRASGGGGSGGQTNAEYQVEEFYTQISANKYQISLKAAQRDLETLDDRLTGEIQIEAGKIAQIVTNVGKDGTVTAASIVLAINNAGSSAAINAENIFLNGQTIVKDGHGLTATDGTFTNLYAGSGTGAFIVEGNNINAYSRINAEGGLYALDGASVVASNGNFTSLTVGSDAASWQSKSVVTGVARSISRNYVYAVNGDITNLRTASGSIVTDVYTTTIYYLGHT